MTTIHLTTELPHQVGDKLYVVSGRMQGDDEDVTFTLAAKDHEHAVKGFAESLAKSRNLEVNEMLRQIKFNWGDDYPYVTCVTEVGTIVCDHEFEPRAEDGGCLSMSQPVIYVCAKCGAKEEE